MKKKAKPGLWPDVSILIVTCLAITTFIRGTWQFWLLFAAFAVWCTYAVCNHLLPFLWEQRDQKEARDLRKLYEKRHFALGLMILASVVTMGFFKYKKWL